MTRKVTVPTKTNEPLEGALCEPPGSGKTGAVVVVHEWHGLNEVMQRHGEELAQAGFLSLVPDLFHGRVASTDAEAAAMITTFDFQKAVGEIGAAVAYLRAHPRGNGRVAVVGFCLGGALALATARYVPGVDAVVPFYGLPRFPTDEFTSVKTPICGHYARVDDWANPAVAEEIQQKVRAGGGQMDLHVYDAAHAFMRSTDPTTYEPNSAALAWQRTVDFLRRHIG